MASFAEAMRWHTERFLGWGPGGNIDAYPRQNPDGTYQWWTFDGQLIDSPLGATAPKSTQPKPESTPTLALRDHPDSARRLCAIACKGLEECSGMYGYDAEYGDAVCDWSGRYVKVSQALYRTATT